MRTLPYMRRSVMLPLNGGPSTLLEKRLSVYHNTGLSDSASQVGDRNVTGSDIALLTDDAITHVNNAEDPGSSTVSFVSTAAQNMERSPSLTDSVSFGDFVHAALDGYTPPGGGGGDTYLGRHTVTVNENTVIGQPVYISDNNTVNLADSDSRETSHVIGLAETSANSVTGNNTANILSEGTINQEDWTAVTATQYLTPGETYYLRGGRGTMSTTPPSGDGDSLVSCGIAITTTKFSIEINEIAVL